MEQRFRNREATHHKPLFYLSSNFRPICYLCYSLPRFRLGRAKISINFGNSIPTKKKIEKSNKKEVVDEF